MTQLLSWMDTPQFLGGPVYAEVHNQKSKEQPAAPPPATAPQIDPNSGIGYGLGGYGTLPGDQASMAQQQMLQQQMAALLQKQAEAKAASAKMGGLAGGVVDTTYQDQINALQAKINAAGPDMSDVGRFAGLAAGARGQAAPQVGHVSLNPNAGLGDYQNFLQDRSQLGGVADAVRLRALGLGGPSVAEQQLAQGRDMAMNNALSIARSQRGGGTGLGTIEALRANMGTMGDYNRQAGMLRAQEQLGAQGMYGNLMNAQQAQDLAARNQSFGQDFQTGQFNLGQGQFNAGLAMQQQGINNAREQEMLNYYMRMREMQMQNAQFNAGMRSTAAGQGITNAYNQGQLNIQQQGINMQREAQDRANTNAWLNAGGTVLAHYATTSPSPQPAQPTQPSSPNNGYGPGYGDTNTIVNPWSP